MSNKIHPSNPNKYSCFKNENNNYTCTYNDFKTIYFDYRFVQPLSQRQKEIIIDVPFYVPKFYVKTYLARKLNNNSMTDVNMRVGLPPYEKGSSYSNQWQPLIDKGICKIKN